MVQREIAIPTSQQAATYYAPPYFPPALFLLICLLRPII